MSFLEDPNDGNGSEDIRLYSWIELSSMSTHQHCADRIKGHLKPFHDLQ